MWCRGWAEGRSRGRVQYFGAGGRGRGKTTEAWTVRCDAMRERITPASWLAQDQQVDGRLPLPHGQWEGVRRSSIRVKWHAKYCRGGRRCEIDSIH